MGHGGHGTMNGLGDAMRPAFRVFGSSSLSLVPLKQLWLTDPEPRTLVQLTNNGQIPITR